MRDDRRDDRLKMPLSAPMGAGTLARVIILQSDPHRAMARSYALQQLGYSAVAADNREHAVEVARESDRPIIAFIDLNDEPDLVTHQAAQMRAACGARACLVITPANPEQVETGIEGCDFLVGRRYNDAGLTAAIHRALGQLQMGQSHRPAM